MYRCAQQPCKSHPGWSYNTVVYELNTRQFSPSGDFAGVLAELPRLHALGVGVIWMMPVHPIGQERRKGPLGSYYSVRDYTGVNPEFGTLEQFRDIVDTAHRLGMQLIIDWVPNHTSRDAVWIAEHPEWYKHDPATGEIATPFDWTDTAQLDYSNREMRAAMIGAMQYWLQETGIDGFRVDMAMLEPIDFWNEAIVALQQTKPDIFMLAEAEGAEFHAAAFDATYAWERCHLLEAVARGEAGPAALCDKLRQESAAYPPDAFRLNFTSNHDENSWNGSEFERFGTAACSMAALCYVLPGMPLIYNGQEVGSATKLEFFDRHPIEWSSNETALRYTLFYQELNALRRDHPALAGGTQGGDLRTIDSSRPDKVFAVKRAVDGRVVLGLFNFSGDHVDLTFDDPDFAGEYAQVGSPEKARLASGAHFYLPPWGFFVYYK